MKLRYNGINIGPISLTDISSSITAGPSGINFVNIVSQNQTLPPGPTVIEFQDSDEVVKSYHSGQIKSYIDSGNFTIDIPPLDSAEFTPGNPSNWQIVPPNDIYDALDQAAAIASSYGNGSATSILLASGSPIGDASHILSTVYTNAINANPTFDLKIAGNSVINVDAARTFIDQDLLVGGTVTLNADPVNPLEAVTKQYADNLIALMDIKDSVRLASTTNLPLIGLTAVDGVTVVAGDRILVKDQASAKDNGIYLASAGMWSRAIDADTSAEINAATFVFVEEGLTNADSGWVLTTDNPFVVGTDDINFSKFTENIQAGTGLTRLGNVLSIDALYVGQTSITTLGTIGTGTWQGSAIDAAYGGTGLSSLGAANRILSMNVGASALEYRSLTGTLNQVNIVFSAGNVALSLPQSIHSGATPTFAGLTLSGLTPLKPIFTDASGVLVSNNTTGSGNVVMSLSPVFTGTISTQNLNVSAGYNLTLAQDPTLALHAATKQYVDSVSQGLDVKESVRLATTAADGNLNLAVGGLLTIDGTITIAGDRVLVKNQTLAQQNGVYIASAGAWIRSADADSNADVTSGMFTFVSEGFLNANAGYVLATSDPIILTVTPLTFVQFSGSGSSVAGAGLTQTGNQFDIGTASISRIVVNADDIDLAMTGVVAGTYTKLTVDVYGRSTLGAQATTTDIEEGTNLYFTNDRARSALLGTANRINFNLLTGVIDIDAAYEGQTSITTLGMVTIGDWQGSVIDLTYGGTNNSSYTLNKFLAFDGTMIASTSYDSSSFLAASAILGTTGQLAKFTSSNVVGDSVIGENAARIFIGGVDDGINKLQVNGPTKITGTLEVTSTSTLSGVVMSISTKTANHTLLPTDYTVEFNCTSGNLVATLPLSPITGQIFNICKIDNSANSLTLLGNGSTINGVSSWLTAVQYFSWTIQYNGTEWRVL